MITKNNIKTLDIIYKNLVNKDWKEANKNSIRTKLGRFTPTGKERKWNPYSLSSETLEVRKLLILANKEDISREEEIAIKDYLIKMKLKNSDLIEDIRSYNFN